jgi:hypothetical protein
MVHNGQRSVSAKPIGNKDSYYKEEGCELFCGPARSQDLNPLENLFHIVKT